MQTGIKVRGECEHVAAASERKTNKSEQQRTEQSF